MAISHAPRLASRPHIASGVLCVQIIDAQVVGTEFPGIVEVRHFSFRAVQHLLQIKACHIDLGICLPPFFVFVFTLPGQQLVALMQIVLGLQ